MTIEKLMMIMNDARNDDDEHKGDYQTEQSIVKNIIRDYENNILKEKKRRRQNHFFFLINGKIIFSKKKRRQDTPNNKVEHPKKRSGEGARPLPKTNQNT